MTRKEAWTPEAVRTVAQALYGPTWQTRLAVAVSVDRTTKFPPVRVRQWFLENNCRPIPAWLQERLSAIFMEALWAHDCARTIAVRELALRRGDTPWPVGFRHADTSGT